MRERSNVEDRYNRVILTFMIIFLSLTDVATLEIGAVEFVVMDPFKAEGLRLLIVSGVEHVLS